MKGLKTFLLLSSILAFVIASGCTGPATSVHSDFDDDEATYQMLSESMEELKAAFDDSTHVQYRLKKALRHISKYFKDPGKREMAIRGLAYCAAASDDGDVVVSCNARLETILKDQNEDLALRKAVIDAKRDIVTGRLGLAVEDSSMFSDDVDYTFELPDTDEREEALGFLMDEFVDLEGDLQYQAIKAFEVILTNPPVCLERSDAGCDETDEEDQKEWKAELLEEFGDWLDEDIELVHKLALIQIATDAGLKLDTGSFWVEEWLGIGGYETDVEQALQASVNRLKGLHYGITPEGQEQTAEGQNTGFVASADYLDFINRPDNTFWINNTHKILELQLFDPNTPLIKEGADLSGPRAVPSEWAFYAFDETNPQSLQLKYLVNRAILDALRKGASLSKSDQLSTNLQNRIEGSIAGNSLNLEQTLELASLSYPSLQQGAGEAQILFDLLERGFQEAPDLYQKRLYLNTITDGVYHFKDLTEAKVCSALDGLDIYSEHLIKVRALKVLRQHQPKDTAADQQMATEEQPEGSYFYFCGEDLKEILKKNVSFKANLIKKAPEATMDQEEAPAEPTETAPEGEPETQNDAPADDTQAVETPEDTQQNEQ